LTSLIYQDAFLPTIVCATSAFVFCREMLGRTASYGEINLTARVIKDYRVQK
jgi:hypothetical protein